MFRFSKFFLLAVSCLFFFACGDDNANSGAEGQSILHYNQPSPITSLDPAFARTQNNIWAAHHLFDGLVQLDDDLNVKPSLAARWDISEDGKTYTFHLRPDVYFHDHEGFDGGKGRLMTAQDFVYSFNRILDTEVGSPGAWIFDGRIAESDAFSAPNDSTFVVTLQKAFRPMLGILTMQYCSVVPKEIVDKYGRDFRANPVGTGPFKFKRWIENQALFLTKNEKYWEKDSNGNALPYLDGVRVSFISDRKTAYLEFIKGEIDLFSGLEASFVDELLTSGGELQDNIKDKVNFVKAPYLNTEYLGINMEIADKPLSEKKIRQALNYGFDRELMLKTLRNNVGKAADAGFIPRGLPSYNSGTVKGYSYQPDKVNTLLAEAGYPNGKDMPEVKLLTNKDYLDLGNFIVKQWEELGINAKVEVMENSTLREGMRQGRAPFFRASWIADYPDGESFLTVFYGGNPAPPNYTHFKNAEFDQYYVQSLNENDDAARQDLYQKMDAILVENAPVIFLFYDETALFVNADFEGISKNAINLLNLKRVKRVK